MTPAEKRITQARAWLLRENVWLGALSLRLAPQADTTVDYMATDGITLKYNPDAIVQDTTEAIAGAWAHETAHCALGHFARRGDRDPETWNVAADHAANLLLLDAGFTLPDGALADPRFTGWAVERIYASFGRNPPSDNDKKKAGKGRIDDAPQAPGQGDDGQPGDAPADAPGNAPGSPGNAPGGKQPTPQELAQEWSEAGADAEIVAQARGTMPGDLARALTKHRTKPQDWRGLLREFATDPAKSDFRWTPPNRRHVWRGCYLPGMRSEELGILACTIDTSGSISAEQTAAFIAEARAMLESGIVAELVLIACDARAHLVGRFQRGDDIDVTQLPGGGGTAFAPAFDLLAAEGIAPTCHAYLTDLEGSFPDEAPAYPTLWIATQPGRAPFGTVVEM